MWSLAEIVRAQSSSQSRAADTVGSTSKVVDPDRIAKQNKTMSSYYNVRLEDLVEKALQGSLSEAVQDAELAGKLDERGISHGAKFDLNTGVPLSLPAYEAVSTYEVLVENDEVFIEYEA